MLVYDKLPVINNCKTCQGTGVIQSFPLDGGPYYSWMKSNKKTCDVCNGKEENK